MAPAVTDAWVLLSGEQAGHHSPHPWSLGPGLSIPLLPRLLNTYSQPLPLPRRLFGLGFYTLSSLSHCSRCSALPLISLRTFPVIAGIKSQSLTELTGLSSARLTLHLCLSLRLPELTVARSHHPRQARTLPWLWFVWNFLPFLYHMSALFPLKIQNSFPVCPWPPSKFPVILLQSTQPQVSCSFCDPVISFG